MASYRDWDRHSWCGAFSKEPRLDMYLPLGALQLDRADRAVLRVADERDTVQKKTFTKWVNKHLMKVQRLLIRDLFEDLRDGLNLITLLEALSHRRFPRERGRMRCHMIQNVQTVLNYLHRKRIKYVNIRADEIVDGNPKLTLGLIWTFILHFQVGDMVVRGNQVTTDASVREALLQWCQKMVEGYPGVKVKDFSTSWKDGLALLAILHRHRPDMIDFNRARRQTPRSNLTLAFEVAEQIYGVTPLLDPEDIDVPEPDEKSVITYVSFLYDLFPDNASVERTARDNERRMKMEEYHDTALQLNQVLFEATSNMTLRDFPTDVPQMKIVLSDFNRFRQEEVPQMMRMKQKLMNLFEEINLLSIGCREFLSRENPLHLENINKSWERFALSQQERDTAIHSELSRLERVQRLADKLGRDIQLQDNNLKNAEKKYSQELSKLRSSLPLSSSSRLISRHTFEAMTRSTSSLEPTLRGLQGEVEALSGCCGGAELEASIKELQVRLRRLMDLLENEYLPLMSPPMEEQSSQESPRVVPSTPVAPEPDWSEKLFDEVQQANDWVKQKQVTLDGLVYEKELEKVKKVHMEREKLNEEILNFKAEVKRLVDANRSRRTADSTRKLNEMLSKLELSYSDLQRMSVAGLKNSEQFLRFSESTFDFLEKLYSVEIDLCSHPWNSQTLSCNYIRNLQKKYTDALKSLESENVRLSSDGENLIKFRHPGSSIVNSISAMRADQWRFLHEIVDYCIQVHLSSAQQSDEFFNSSDQLRRLTSFQNSALTLLQADYDEVTLEDGEQLLLKLQKIQLVVGELENRAMILRNQASEMSPVTIHTQKRFNDDNDPERSIVSVKCLCSPTRDGTQISSGESFSLEKAQLTQSPGVWDIRTRFGQTVKVPSVCFQVSPPCNNVLDTIESLTFDIHSLLMSCQEYENDLRYRMLLATVELVRSWDSYQLPGNVGSEQILSIIDTILTDGEKYLSRVVGSGSLSNARVTRLENELAYCRQIASSIRERLASGSVTMMTSVTSGDGDNLTSESMISSSSFVGGPDDEDDERGTSVDKTCTDGYTFTDKEIAGAGVTDSYHSTTELDNPPSPLHPKADDGDDYEPEDSSTEMQDDSTPFCQFIGDDVYEEDVYIDPSESEDQLSPSLSHQISLKYDDEAIVGDADLDETVDGNLEKKLTDADHVSESDKEDTQEQEFTGIKERFDDDKRKFDDEETSRSTPESLPKGREEQRAVEQDRSLKGEDNREPPGRSGSDVDGKKELKEQKKEFVMQTLTRIKKGQSITPETHGQPMVLDCSERIVAFYNPNSLLDAACPLSLTDCIVNGFYDSKNGHVLDKFSSVSYSIENAIDLGLIDPQLDRFVVDRTNLVYNLERAVRQEVLDLSKGNIQSMVMSNPIDLQSAAGQGLLFKALSPADVLTNYSLPTLDSQGNSQVLVVVPRVGAAENPRKRDAIDYDTKSIIDTESGNMLSLKQMGVELPMIFQLLNSSQCQILDRSFMSTERGITDLRGSFPDHFERRTLLEALEHGLIEIDGSTTPASAYYLSPEGRWLSLEEAFENDLMSLNIFKLLSECFIKLNDGEIMNIPECLERKFIDLRSGKITIPNMPRPLTFEECQERGIMDAETTALLMLTSCSYAVITNVITSIQHLASPISKAKQREFEFEAKEHEEPEPFENLDATSVENLKPIVIVKEPIENQNVMDFEQNWKSLIEIVIDEASSVGSEERDDTENVWKQDDKDLKHDTSHDIEDTTPSNPQEEVDEQYTGLLEKFGCQKEKEMPSLEDDEFVTYLRDQMKKEDFEPKDFLTKEELQHLKDDQGKTLDLSKDEKVDDFDTTMVEEDKEKSSDFGLDDEYLAEMEAEKDHALKDDGLESCVKDDGKEPSLEDDEFMSYLRDQVKKDDFGTEDLAFKEKLDISADSKEQILDLAKDGKVDDTFQKSDIFEEEKKASFDSGDFDVKDTDKVGEDHYQENDELEKSGCLKDVEDKEPTLEDDEFLHYLKEQVKKDDFDPEYLFYKKRKFKKEETKESTDLDDFGHENENQLHKLKVEKIMIKLMIKNPGKIK